MVISQLLQKEADAWVGVSNGEADACSPLSASREWSGRVQRELQVSTRLGITHCGVKMPEWKRLVPGGVTSKAFLCQEETHSSHSAHCLAPYKMKYKSAHKCKKGK